MVQNALAAYGLRRYEDVASPSQTSIYGPGSTPFRIAARATWLGNEIGAKLAGVRNVVGVVLGGSYARGTAKATSDLDFGIYYAEGSPFDIARIREVAKEISSPGAPPTVTGLYEWGPWVNGGAWIVTAQGKVDFLYRRAAESRLDVKAAPSEEGVAADSR